MKAIWRLLKSGPGVEPLCNREAQVGAPDLDLAFVPNLCVCGLCSTGVGQAARGTARLAKLLGLG